MMLSLAILLDHLRDLPLETHIPQPNNDKVSFSRASVLPRRRDDMRQNLIYVCRLSDALRVTADVPNMWYLCIRDRIRDDTENDEDFSGMIIVNKNMDVEELLNRVQEFFDKICDWILQIQRALIREKSLQEILDLSTDVIGNTINITDSAFFLLARTNSIETDDSISSDLIKYGYHPESTLQIFRKAHRFEVWTQSQSMFINDSREISNYILVSKVYRFRSTYFAHVVMVCDHHPMSDGLMELFAMLADMIAIHAERNWNDKSALSHNYDSFLVDLLNGTLTNPATIQERASYLSLRTDGQLQLLKVTVENNMEATLGRVGRELSDMLPTAQVLYYKHSICVLIHLQNGSSCLPAESLLRLLAEHSAHGGLSNVFVGPEHLPAAYDQASLALKYNAPAHAALLGEGEDEGERLLCSFQDHVLRALLGEYPENEKIWRSSVYYQGLKTLHDYDCQHATNNLPLLRSYLRHERKATETGQAMHMHRNNVIYRIDRIEKMMGMELDDCNTRLGLNMSFLLLEQYGFAPETESAEQPAT